MKIERLAQVLERLNELKQEGQHEGIDEKIAEVRETLQQYVTNQEHKQQLI